jgi:hypothetical protein
MLLIFARYVDRQQVIPPSLNYFGFLGPSGKGFGELVYHCKDCVLENIKFKTIDLMVEDENADINFNAIVSSPSDSVEIKFEAVVEDEK